MVPAVQPGRFNAQQASAVLFAQTLQHVAPDAVYVVGGDATQTPRSSRTLEGAGWLRNPRTPPFMTGIHAAQRWFNGSWLLPAEQGYSRALPLRWLPAFTAKSWPVAHPPATEWEAAAVSGLGAAGVDLSRAGAPEGADGGRRPLRHAGLVAAAAGGRDLAGAQCPEPRPVPSARRPKRARTAAQIWRPRLIPPATLTAPPGLAPPHPHGARHSAPPAGEGARSVSASGCTGAPAHADRGARQAQRAHPPPLPFLVNAVQDENGAWGLPLPLATLLFWAWQRWELEVCHRELKANFGLGDKQCWNPIAAVASVQWSAWVYALLLLAGYRTWGLSTAPPVPTRWWRGASRWSLNTLWRAFRATVWGDHDFRPLCAPHHG
ncbi:MAG: hypothetical protein M5R40_27775 [Anaerolineae bacterium]|nr:hypothetical protein [Anaerolineae bacterium]